MYWIPVRLSILTLTWTTLVSLSHVQQAELPTSVPFVPPHNASPLHPNAL